MNSVEKEIDLCRGIENNYDFGNVNILNLA